MEQVNYWLFNMDYKNNKGDIIWQYCKNNNCFAMLYQDEKQEKSRKIEFKYSERR